MGPRRSGLDQGIRRNPGGDTSSSGVGGSMRSVLTIAVATALVGTCFVATGCASSRRVARASASPATTIAPGTPHSDSIDGASRRGRVAAGRPRSVRVFELGRGPCDDTCRPPRDACARRRPRRRHGLRARAWQVDPRPLRHRRQRRPVDRRDGASQRVCDRSRLDAPGLRSPADDDKRWRAVHALLPAEQRLLPGSVRERCLRRSGGLPQRAVWTPRVDSSPLERRGARVRCAR